MCTTLVSVAGRELAAKLVNCSGREPRVGNNKLWVLKVFCDFKIKISSSSHRKEDDTQLQQMYPHLMPISRVVEVTSVQWFYLGSPIWEARFFFLLSVCCVGKHIHFDTGVTTIGLVFSVVSNKDKGSVVWTLAQSNQPTKRKVDSVSRFV